MTLSFSAIRAGAVAGASAIAFASAAFAQPAERPNILLILADDMGYSDIGAFGSEIRTPNLDALAAAGMVLTNFHAGPVCNITRLELMTGIDNNVATDPQGASAATRTALRKDTLTIAEALDAAGYRSYLAGKWDLGQREDQSPKARGFDRSFAMLPGTASHYDEKHLAAREPVYREGDTHVTELPDDFYSTRFYTDKLLEFLEAGKESEAPFFAYLSYTAPHFPLQAPAEYIDRYDGVYSAGYDAIRDARLRRMRMSGLLAEDFADNPIAPAAVKWEAWPSWEERKLDARRMQVYAGMIDYMDEQIGRVVSYLDAEGELDNTLIVFTSDNGATSGWTPPVFVDHGGGAPDDTYENLGRPGSYMSAGDGWGWVSNAPFKGYKQMAAEGGHSVPAIAFLPGTIPDGSRSDAFLNVRDLLPTFMGFAGATLPATTAVGEPTVALDGRSALPVLSGAVDARPHAGEAVAFKSGEIRYLYKDDWKIVMNADGAWELYDVATNRSEQQNLADENPAKLKELVAAWEANDARLSERIAQ